VSSQRSRAVVLDGLFECLVEEEREVLQEAAELSAS